MISYFLCNRSQKACLPIVDIFFYLSKVGTFIIIFELKLMADKVTSKSQAAPVNYLCDEGKIPDKRTQQFYEFDKVEKRDYSEVWGSQSHSRRRKMILQRHPQVAKLLVPDKHYSIYIAFFVIILGMVTTYYVKDTSWPVFLTVLYVLGGTYGHTLHVLIHDFTHFGGHKNIMINKIMGVLCNIPMGIPSALSFGKYHADHHNYLNEKGRDPDLPMRIQSVCSRFPPFKLFFWFFITLFYAFRPMFCYTRKIEFDQILNYVFIISVDLIILKYWGVNALIYLLLVAFLSIGPHPAAIHVLAEHFEFVKGLETYDYIGPMNIINLDLGYHIEHHDFPTCPWYNLRKLRKAAPQFYENLPYHTSYLKVIYKFLLDTNFNLFNRTHRINKKIQ